MVNYALNRRYPGLAPESVMTQRRGRWGPLCQLPNLKRLILRDVCGMYGSDVYFIREELMLVSELRNLEIDFQQGY
jgi:hypothetical protein